MKIKNDESNATEKAKLASNQHPLSNLKKVHLYIPEFMHMSLGEGSGNNFWGDVLNSSGAGGRDGGGNMVISDGQCGQPAVVVHYIAEQ